MASLFQRREAPPALFVVFCGDWLHLSRTTTDQLWAALRASRWSRAVSLRQLVQLHEAIDQDWRSVRALYTHAMSPQELVAVCEDLITEGLLSAVVSRRIEEHILQQTTQDGTWEGHHDRR